MSKKKCYIYILKDPSTLAIRYVGKSINPKERYRKHLFYSLYPRTHAECWVKSLVIKNLLPTMEIVACVQEGEWENTEREFILKYKNQGCDLTNIAEGGNGNKLLYAPIEVRERWLAKLRETYAYKTYSKEQLLERAERARLTHTGRKRSKLTRKRLSETKIGRLNPMFGKLVPKERREKLSIAAKKRGLSSLFFKRSREASMQRQKPVIQISLSGEEIASYRSIKIAAITTRCHHANIIACCKGRLGKTGGFRWKYG